MEVSDNKFVDTYFAMLNKCIEQHKEGGLMSVIIQETEELAALGIDNLDPFVIKKLRILFPHLKKEYDEVVEEERINSLKKNIQPVATVPLLETYEFNSNRCVGTAFDVNFQRTSGDSMLLFINMHGAIVINNNNESIINRCTSLNKFSSSGVGQCVVFSMNASRYIAYTLCHAIQTGGALDIDTIIRESRAHKNMKPGDNPEKIYQETPTSVAFQHHAGVKRQSECKSRNFQEVNYSDQVLGNETTFGTQYLEKKYSVGDPSECKYITICKEWVEIGASPMDNLLENEVFQMFIIEKYFPTEGDDVHKRITSSKTIRNFTDNVVVIGKILLSDIIEFCESHGRPRVSIIDNSCSLFSGTHPYTTRQIGNILKNLPDDPTIAKGIKTKRKKRKLLSKKKTKGQNNLKKRR
jgi:hypothetical protein